ncbi:ATP-grasp domain-containing protein [Hahella sp. NBU794]|uniref:ATP-grasp domain-containing protein n=1 Tax=Hahella sp. NBU794 TaxID=3422590 RepID=UPI003D6FE5CC
MTQTITKFKDAFVQEQGNGRLNDEAKLVVEYLESNDVEITFFTDKFIRRRSLDLTPQSLVMADIPCMHGAMKQLGINIPVANSYPASLKQYLRRNIWESELSQLLAEIMNGLSAPVFAKPGDTQKKFTGRVFESMADLYFVSGCSKKTRIVCSDVVHWISEYRVYVVNSEIVDISHYAGKTDVALDEAVVSAAIQALDRAGESYAGYGIDFGVLGTGETALIEMNDGYGLGAYNISAQDYGRLVSARWAEIVATL